MCVQEMIAAQNASSGSRHLEVDMDDLMDDPELERLHAERLYAMQKVHINEFYNYPWICNK